MYDQLHDDVEALDHVSITIQLGDSYVDDLKKPRVNGNLGGYLHVYFSFLFNNFTFFLFLDLIDLPSCSVLMFLFMV